MISSLHSTKSSKMKITTKQIVSIPKNGASCHLLILADSIKILLDCGINHFFDFEPYRTYKEEIMQVQAVLISHSSLEYSGAFALLVSQFGMDPKKFYTTHPIMRYAPLNLHEQILNFRFEGYNKKIFDKIYALYEQIQLVKPYQKKVIQIQQDGENNLLIGNVVRSVSFACSLCGGGLGNVAWKINCGLINIVYLIEYSNYSLYQINGMDLQYLRSKPTDILLTDAYQQMDKGKLRKQKLYEEIFKVVIQFNKNYEQVNRTGGIMTFPHKKLLLVCYPNQTMIEVMEVMKRIICELYPTQNRQKIFVIHLSSKYIQLIKSQIQYFSEESKTALDKMDQFFVHSSKLLPRFNIATLQAINGILNDDIKQNDQDLLIYHVGTSFTQKHLNRYLSTPDFFQKYKVFQLQQEENKDVQLQEASIQQQSEINITEKKQQQNKNQAFPNEGSYSKILRQNNPHVVLHSKYISVIGFPHFVKKSKETNIQFDDYGLKHRIDYQQFGHRNNFGIDLAQYEDNNIALSRKKSRIEVMNIAFDIPKSFIPYNASAIKCLGYQINKTDFESSVQIMRILNPKTVVLMNTDLQKREQIVQKYHQAYNNLNKQSKITIIDLSLRKMCHIQLQNQLMQYKIDYIPEQSNSTLQRVKGVIEHRNGHIHIHLQALAEKQILEFRMDQFYKRVKHKVRCSFTGQGILMDGIKIYKKNNQVVLEGEYSEQYFKVRNLLYEFLKIR